MFTDQDPDKEDPQLFWRRDAILTIDMEKKVSAVVSTIFYVNFYWVPSYQRYCYSVSVCPSLCLSRNFAAVDEMSVKSLIRENSSVADFTFGATPLFSIRLWTALCRLLQGFCCLLNHHEHFAEYALTFMVY